MKFCFSFIFLYNLHLNLLSIIVAIITGASAGHCVFCIWSAVRFASRSRIPASSLTDLPPVSILKPLKGADPEMYESFRSHCMQNYPGYEILFGLSDPNDPAAALVQKLQSEFPQRAIRLILCEKRLGANGKVSSLVQLAAEAKHNCLLVNDSDIRVPPDYLKTVITELHEPNIGLVTCLYRGIPTNSIASRIESLGISTDFAAGVLAAEQIEGGLHFGLGSTLAFRWRELEAIGGFEAIVDYLADDYELGKRIAQTGLKVRLAQVVVETFLPAYSFSGFFAHQLRWARTIRVSRPIGYLGLLLTYTLFWAILNVTFARGATWAWALAIGAVALRCAMALVTAVSALRDKQVLRSFWLLPMRDLLAPVVWLVALFGRTVRWRGEQFELDRGKMKRAN